MLQVQTVLIILLNELDLYCASLYLKRRDRQAPGFSCDMCKYCFSCDMYNFQFLRKFCGVTGEKNPMRCAAQLATIINQQNGNSSPRIYAYRDGRTEQQVDTVFVQMLYKHVSSIRYWWNTSCMQSSQVMVLKPNSTREIPREIPKGRRESLAQTTKTF